MNKMDMEKQIQYIQQIREKNEGKNLKYSILTMGCQLNENDSEKLSGMIEQMGYQLTRRSNGIRFNCI